MNQHAIESLIEADLVTEASAKQKKRIKNGDIAGCVDTVHVHEGDLVLDGELSLYDGGTLLVLGNLTVSESVMTDETATLVVTGDMRCRHLYLEGNLEVQGNLDVRGVIYGFYEAGVSRVLGKTRARIGLFGNHDWECDDEKYEVSAQFSNNHELSEGDPAVLRKVLGEKAFLGLGRMMGIEGAPEPKGNEAWGLNLLKHL